MMDYIFPPYEIVITGKEAKGKVTELYRYYIPNKIILGTATQSDLPLLKEKQAKDETLIYVCVDKVCQLPVRTVEEIISSLVH